MLKSKLWLSGLSALGKISWAPGSSKRIFFSDSATQPPHWAEASLAFCVSAKLWSTPDQTVWLCLRLNHPAAFSGTSSEVSMMNFYTSQQSICHFSPAMQSPNSWCCSFSSPPGCWHSGARISLSIFFFFFGKFHQTFAPHKKTVLKLTWQVNFEKLGVGRRTRIVKSKHSQRITFAFRHLFQSVALQKVSCALSKVFLLTKDELLWNRSHAHHPIHFNIVLTKHFFFPFRFNFLVFFVVCFFSNAQFPKWNL